MTWRQLLNVWSFECHRENTPSSERNWFIPATVAACELSSMISTHSRQITVAVAGLGTLWATDLFVHGQNDVWIQSQQGGILVVVFKLAQEETDAVDAGQFLFV